MAKKTIAGPIRAAVYYRYSTDEQEDSLARQQSQVEPHLTRKGYVRVAEEQDLGIPGSEFEKRPGFQRLLARAEAGEFDVIVCDDQDRFSRFSPLKFCSILDRLQDAGVRLETVSQGAIDLDDFAGFLIAQVRQHHASAEAPKIGERVLKQFLRRAKEGIDIGGHAPFGYRYVPDDLLGRKLVPDEEERVKVVRWLFETYDEKDTSLKALCIELHKRGVKSPSGKDRWNPTGVHQLLTNRAYVGDFVRFEEQLGSWARLEGGQVKATGRKLKRGRYPESEWIVVPDHHEAIIDRDLFTRVRAKLADNARHTSPRPGGTDHLFGRRFLVCGHCGSWMIGTTWTVRGKRVRKYMCGGHNQFGNEFCHPAYIDEATVLDHVVPELQKALVGPDFLAELRAEARRQEEADHDPAAERGLRKRIDKLARDINQGNRNLALLPADRLPSVITQVRAWEIEKKQAEAELDRVTNASAVAETEEAIAKLEKRLWNLRECLEKGKAEDVRGVLRELLTKIEVWVDAVPWGKKRHFRLIRGVIHVRADEVTSPDSSKTRRGR